MDHRFARAARGPKMSEAMLADRIVLLRLFRLKRLPPAQYSAEILSELGYPLIVVEYGNVHETTPDVAGKLPRARLANPLAGLFPKKLQMPAIVGLTLLRL